MQERMDMGDTGEDREAGKPNGAWRADLIKAIDHPLRRRVLRLLGDRDEPLSPAQMAEELDFSLSMTAYHIRILYELRAVARAGRRQVRGALQRFYKSKVKDDPPIATLLEETREVDDAKSRAEENGSKKGKKRE
jgi:DNA-binding transcriptional ArsR family regulator